MSGVRGILGVVLDGSVLAEHAPPAGCPDWVGRAYQYPRLWEGMGPFSSHQVWIRGPWRGGVGGGGGGGVGGELKGMGHQEVTASDELARRSASDLHIDPWDGGGALGTCTVHVCRRRDKEGGWDGSGGWVSPPADEERHLACKGVAVFPGKHGGRGVHIHSMVPGWNCAILMRTSCVLHGSVVPEPERLAGFGCRHLDMMRVVTYPLKRVETLLARIARDEEAIAELYNLSDAWVQSRMRECSSI